MIALCAIPKHDDSNSLGQVPIPAQRNQVFLSEAMLTFSKVLCTSVCLFVYGSVLLCMV